MKHEMCICKRMAVTVLFSIGSFLWVSTQSQAAAGPDVSLISDAAPGLGALHGLSKVKLALKNKEIRFEQVASPEGARGEILIVCGIADGPGAAGKMLKSQNIAKPDEAESLLIRHVRLGGKKTLLASGADDRGLMYALLDVADRIGWAGSGVVDRFQWVAVHRNCSPHGCRSGKRTHSGQSTADDTPNRLGDERSGRVVDAFCGLS